MSKALVKHTSKSPVAEGGIALKDLTLPQLGEAFFDLDAAEQKYTKMSGVCLTLKGLVLIEVKHRLGHGKYTPWLKDNFPKSARSAQRAVKVANAFLGKSDTTVAFGILTKDLQKSLLEIQARELDLANPAVLKVVEWVNDRSAYQLMLELEDEETKRRGGANNPEPGKKKSPAEVLGEITAVARQWVGEQLGHSVFKKRLWTTLEDTEIKALISHHEEHVEAMRKWIDTPKARRAQISLEDFAP